jgi:D-beta-D-heptose 7-phosphate kinase / D-beta-D-heptose 1-phosphate adenosyltransferase
MNGNLLQVINAFSGLRVMVIGEAMLDTYLEGFSDRLCREAPVPVVNVTDRDFVPGGAGNTAVNVRSLGAEVILLSIIGDDSEGMILKEVLEEKGVDTRYFLRSPDRRTLAKQRVISASQMLVRFDQGDTEPLDSALEEALIENITQFYPYCDAIIISDYNYGILTPNVIRALEECQRDDPHLLVVDSKRLPIYQNLNVTAVKPNYSEAQELLGLTRLSDSNARLDQIIQNGREILEMTGAHIAAVTLDQIGALVFSQEESAPYRTYAKPVPHSKAAGAGDTFVSALTLALAAGAHFENAAELASAAASIVVSKNGTSTCHVEELISHFSAQEKVVTDIFQLVAGVAAYRRENKRVVFTNGCFDILHRGHITYLNRAKACGEILIVGINSDESVRRLKGESRPINSLEDRAQILAALSCVDHIVPFNSDTPHELIRMIRPDIFVKGGDYSRETLPEASLVEKLGGKVEILPYLENLSTTNIIERIRQIDAGTTPKKG